MSNGPSLSREPLVSDLHPEVWCVVRIGHGLKRQGPYLRTRIYNLIDSHDLFHGNIGYIVHFRPQCQPMWKALERRQVAVPTVNLKSFGILPKWEVPDGEW